MLGLILDAGELKNNILRPALPRIVSTDGISWVVRDREGGSLLASDRAGMGSPAVQSDFVSRFPDWSLAIYQQPPNFVGAFLGTRHGIYSYMFLLIGRILIFGLALTIRTVSHELELAKMKSDLVSTISHEFKSPLAAIRQLAEMLHSGRIPSEDRRQKYYDILLEQSERLSLLTDNVLNLARIEEGKPKGAPIVVKAAAGRMHTLGFTRSGSFYFGVGGAGANIYVVTLDPATGKILAEPEKLVRQFEGYNRSPRYSPDGKYLAYISKGARTVYPTGSGWGDSLYVRSLETGQEREYQHEITRLGVIWLSYPRWSPDGRSILLHGRDRRGRYGIYCINLETAKAVCILRQGENEFISFAVGWRDNSNFLYGRVDKKIAGAKST